MARQRIRELEHAIERILILEDTDIILGKETSRPILSGNKGIFRFFLKIPSPLKNWKKNISPLYLKKAKGKKVEAARILGINRKTLSTKINKYGLK